MFRILFQPYPYTAETSPNIRFHIWIGVFVSFFLIVFQPFGTDQWITENKILKLLGYGIISFAVPTILFFIRNFISKGTDIDTKYVVWHEVVWYLIIILCIAFGNMVYAYFLGINNLSFSSFYITAGIVLSIGVFPVFASILIKHQQYLSINQKVAESWERNLQDKQTKENLEEANHSPHEILTFLAENEKDKLVFNAHDLMYIESQDNYSAFIFDKEGQIKKDLLRGSLRKFESQISNVYITRCHRSFIVNLKKVEHIKGNAQGYIITLNQGQISIPVSRNYTSQISQLLDK